MVGDEETDWVTLPRWLSWLSLVVGLALGLMAMGFLAHSVWHLLLNGWRLADWSPW